MSHHDVIVIGGGTLVHRLAPSGAALYRVREEDFVRVGDQLLHRLVVASREVAGVS
jgi:hypothetical protein